MLPKKPPAPDRHEIACLGLWRFHFYLSWLKKISRRIRAREGPPSLVHPPPASIHTHTVGSQVNWGGVSGCSWVAFSGQGHPTHSCASSSPGPTGGGGGGRQSLSKGIDPEEALLERGASSHPHPHPHPAVNQRRCCCCCCQCLARTAAAADLVSGSGVGWGAADPPGDRRVKTIDEPLPREAWPHTCDADLIRARDSSGWGRQTP